MGLDAYQGVIASQADVIYLATPPGFRPLISKRRWLRANMSSWKSQWLSMHRACAEFWLQAKRQRPRDCRFKWDCNEDMTVALSGLHGPSPSRCTGSNHTSASLLDSAGMWTRSRKKDQTELEYQLSNWYYFTWLSGDHITEQHIHNLDVINWALQSHPLEAQGQGGRAVRTGPNSGQIFDHHMVVICISGRCAIVVAMPSDARLLVRHW